MTLNIDKPENLRTQNKALAEEIIKLVREKAELRETVDSLRAEKADLGSKYMASIDEERAENYQLRKDANEWQAKYQMDMDSMNQVIDEERKEKAHPARKVRGDRKGKNPRKDTAPMNGLPNTTT